MNRKQRASKAAELHSEAARLWRRRAKAVEERRSVTAIDKRLTEVEQQLLRLVYRVRV